MIMLRLLYIMIEEVTQLKRKLFICLIWISALFADETDIKLIPSLEKKTIAIKPIAPEKKPLRPIVRPTNIHHHTYYETIVESDCNNYIEIIKEKDAKIEALLKENARLKEVAQTKLQERLKKEYDQEMQKFEDRRK